jgi:hypothetical protein
MGEGYIHKQFFRHGVEDGETSRAMVKVVLNSAEDVNLSQIPPSTKADATVLLQSRQKSSHPVT